MSKYIIILPILLMLTVLAFLMSTKDKTDNTEYNMYVLVR